MEFVRDLFNFAVCLDKNISKTKKNTVAIKLYGPSDSLTHNNLIDMILVISLMKICTLK